MSVYKIVLRYLHLENVNHEGATKPHDFFRTQAFPIIELLVFVAVVVAAIIFLV
ncbi:MAG TPA: hypothetical protein VK766_09535 [Cytophagaceae bacterium]|jgi:hypothetical protein|nr:hypothetical protein [Cytophagaceae bacterium]